MEEELSESEFLRRELGIDWIVSTQNEIVEKIRRNFELKKKTLLLVSDSSKYLHLLSECPTGSVVLFLLSDEAYSPVSYRLATQSSVAVVFRHYDPRPLSYFKGLLLTLNSFSLLAHSPRNLLPFCKLVLHGFRSIYRMNRWNRLAVQVVVCPLGYTSKFAEAYCRIYPLLSVSTSLFHIGMWQDNDRQVTYSFRGNRGQLQRHAMISKFQELDETSDIVMTNFGWNGTHDSELSGLDYVRSLLRARIALCPPGYTNNESFRYYEALICGALPMEMEFALSHMGFLPCRVDVDNAQSVTRRLEVVQQCLSKVRADLIEHLAGV